MAWSLGTVIAVARMRVLGRAFGPCTDLRCMGQIPKQLARRIASSKRRSCQSFVASRLCLLSGGSLDLGPPSARCGTKLQCFHLVGRIPKAGIPCPNTNRGTKCPPLHAWRKKGDYKMHDAVRTCSKIRPNNQSPTSTRTRRPHSTKSHARSPIKTPFITTLC